MSSVSKEISTQAEPSINKLVALTNEEEQTIYNELSTISKKIRSLDESYYGGGEADNNIIPDEVYDALARREAELCARYPHLLTLLEEESGLGKEATRYGGRVGQSYKEVDDESSVDVESTRKKHKKKALTRKSTATKRQKRKHLENAPMQSLDNAMDTPEVVAWLNRVKKFLLSASTDPDDVHSLNNTAKQSIPITIIAEPKIDGLSLSLRYELDERQSNVSTSIYNFVWGATRGDGKQGEDVSEAVKSAWMNNSTSNAAAADDDNDDKNQRFSIPNSFHISENSEHPPPETIEIRGEVVLPQTSFDEFTCYVTASDNNKTPSFSNARNAASGILLRSKEPTSEEALEQTKWLQSRLTFYAYDIVASPTNLESSSNWLSSKFTETSVKMRESLSSIGFQVPNPIVIEDVTFSPDKDNDEADILSLLDYHHKLLEDRVGSISLPYHIDGVVYKVSSLVDRRICGSSSRTPRWAIAHKFPPQCAVTRLNGIEIQVGRTGALTPVALLAPVDLGGVMVARASLHNFHYASKILSSTTDGHVVNKGVEVLVSRAGDVIPQVMKRIFDNDGTISDGTISLEPPKHCPSCGSPTTFGFIGSHTRKKGKKSDGAAKEDTEVNTANDESNDDLEKDTGQVLRCSGPQLLCQPRAINAMAYAYSRAGLDVKGLSKSKLQHLMDENIIRYPADLFVAFGDSSAGNSSVGQGKNNCLSIVLSFVHLHNSHTNCIT
jgi:DNA ligase (NAD+)